MLVLSDLPLNSHQSPQRGWEMVNVNHLNLRDCTGCLSCWLKTPGVCALGDEQEALNVQLARATQLVLVSRVRYGGLDLPMQRALERSRPLRQPFLHLNKGELHHVPRACMAPKEALVVGYDAENRKSRSIFRRLCRRMARSFGLAPLRVVFCSRDQVWEQVAKGVKRI